MGVGAGLYMYDVVVKSSRSLSRWVLVICRLHLHAILQYKQLCYVNFFNLAIERVQALADISRSALYAFAVYKAISLAYICVCCHSIETRALIANPPNSAQLEGTLYRSPGYI